MSNQSVAIPVNASIDLNAVTSVFVARYETQLLDKKTALAGQVKKLKSQRDDFDGLVKGLVDGTAYVSSLPFIKMTTQLGDIEVLWDGNYTVKKPHYQVKCEFVRGGEVKMTDVTIHFIPDNLVEDRNAVLSQLKEAEQQLTETLMSLKQVSQKERQIRGKIAEQSLEQAGMSELLNNPELAKLVMIGN
jgi:hypothetical protein